MDLLKAVNAILPKLGEHPVTSLTGQHSTVDLIVDEVNRQIDQVGQRGWWYNEYPVTLTLNTDSEITIPANTLSFIADMRLNVRPVQRKGRLFNADTLTYKWTAPVSGTIKVRLPFDELPESVASHVWYSALCNALVTDIGVTGELQKWEQSRLDTLAAMEAEHLENMQYSTARSPRYTRINRARFG